MRYYTNKKGKLKMIKVIQTNLSIDNEGVIRDHQGLTYEVESWDSFVEGVKDGEFKVKNSTMPMGRGKFEKPILSLTHDSFHMSVDYGDTKSFFYAAGQQAQ